MMLTNARWRLIVCCACLVLGRGRASDEPERAAPSGGREGDVSVADVTCAQRNQCGRYAGLPFHARNCFCDAVCDAYGDCCRDYATSGEHVIPSSVRGVVSCCRVEDIDTGYELYVVDECPKSYRKGFVRDRCENELAPELFYRLPVTGRTSGVLYRNVYCAICAGDVDVSYWQMAYKCVRNDALNPASIRNIRSANDFRRVAASIRCPVELLPPENMSPRKCKSHVDRCPRRWRDERVSRRCKNHTAYVYVGLQVFKNKHCAICNNINESTTKCEDPRTPWMTFERTLDEPEVQGSAEYVYVIYDTNTGRGIIRSGSGHGAASEAAATVELGSCSEGQRYDVFTGLCRTVACGEGNWSVDGRCPSDLETTPITSAEYETTSASVTAALAPPAAKKKKVPTATLR